MPDYNLGRAHGEIRVTYDGRGVRQADEDLDKLNKTSEATSAKLHTASQQASADFDHLAAASKRLEQEITRATIAEISARARLQAAEQNLASVRSDSAANAQRIAQAQRQVVDAQNRVRESSDRLRQSHASLAVVQAKLARTPRPDVSVKGDVSRMANIENHLKNIDRNSRTSVSGLNAFSGRLKFMISAVALASPQLAGLAVSLVALTGLAGVAAGALAALAAVGGTLATAFSGIANVFKQAGQQAAGSGQSAAQAAQQQRAAARQIEQAIVGVRNAEESLARARVEAVSVAQRAAQQIISAERSLRDAQTASQRAQESLTRARRDAVRQLDDMRTALLGGALDERQAIIDVENAQLDLNKTLADPRSSDLDKRQAILTLEKQQLALERIKEENRRLGEDQAAAAAAGVDGADAVRSAEEDVLHGKENVTDAQLALTDAVVQGARDQIEAQLAIRDAAEAVVNAQKDLEDAYASAATAGSGGAAKMADAMSKISPEARKVVQAILDQSAAWKDVKFVVQDAAFADISKDIAPLAQQWFPLLKAGMVGIAHEINGMIKGIIQFLKQASTTRDVATIFENTRQAVHNLIPAITNLLGIFFNLATVGSSFLPALAQKFTDLTARVKALTDQSRASGAMSEWMQQGIKTAGQLWQLLKNLLGIIGSVFSAFDQSGGGALNTLVMLTGKLNDFLKTAEGQSILKSLGAVLASIGKLIATVLIGGLQALGPAFVVIAPLIQQFADILGKEIFVVLKLLAPVLLGIAHVIEFLGPVLVPLVATLFLLNKALLVVGIAFRILTAIMAVNPFIAIAIAVLALAILIITNWDRIVAFLKAAWELIRSEAVDVWQHIKSAIIDPIVEAFNLIVTQAKQFAANVAIIFQMFLDMVRSAFDHIKSAIIDPIRDAIGSAIDFFGGLPGRILGALSGAADWLVNVGRDIINGLIRGVEQMLGRLWDKISDIGRGIGNAFKNVLSIFSPSKVFQKFGEFTIQGYIVGLDAMQGDVINRVVEIAASITRAGQPEPFLAQPAALVPTAIAAPPQGDRQILINSLTLNVTGNLDPTNPVQWRKALVGIKSGIENVDRESR